MRLHGEQLNRVSASLAVVILIVGKLFFASKVLEMLSNDARMSIGNSSQI